jgi:hypothetical protein
VVCAISGYDANCAAEAVRNICEKYPDVKDKIFNFKFSGQGQRKTRVTDARGIVEVIMLLPGHHAARIRRQAAELLVRYLGGDLSVVDEVCALHAVQEALRKDCPDHPARFFRASAEERIQKRTHEEMEQAIQRVTDAAERIESKFDEALRRIHPSDPSRDFANSARSHNALLDVGVIVEGDELTLLDKDEHVAYWRSSVQMLLGSFLGSFPKRRSCPELGHCKLQ